MRQKTINNSGLARGLMGQLAAEKKKAVTTLCLIIVMAFLWLRVLTKNAPQASQASSIAGQLNSQDQTGQELNISFVELPKVEGRNDVITQDFFTSNGWRCFGNGLKEKAVIEEVNIVSKNGNEEVIRRVAEKLKLEATVVLGTNPRAYINDRVVSVGDKVLIRDGNDTYECEVIEIKENTVVIQCRGAEVTLKLTQASMIDN